MSLDIDFHRWCLEPKLKQLFDKKLRVFEKKKDPDILRKIGNLFYVHDISRDIALQYYLESEKIDPNQFRVLCNIGLVNNEIERYDLAYSYFNKSLNLNINLKARKGLESTIEHYAEFMEYLDQHGGEIPFSNKFGDHEKRKLKEAGINGELANQFKKKYTGMEIIYMVKEGLTPLRANLYLHEKGNPKFVETPRFWARMNELEAVLLNRYKVPPWYARQFPQKFISNDIIDIFEAGKNPEDAFNYRDMLTGAEIAMLMMADCPWDVEQKYHPKIHRFAVSTLYRLNIGPEIKPNSTVVKSLNSIFFFNDVDKHTDKYRLLKTGSDAVILIDDESKSAVKVSPFNRIESKILKKMLKQRWPAPHIIHIKKTLSDDCIQENQLLILEYVKGDSLQDIIETNGISPEKIIDYSSQIVQGLTEMRQNSIPYHRDIRPGNIIIDDKDKITIIDFRYATSNPMKYLRVHGNRRFKGPSDLSSVGQLMYYMATGTSIFAKTPKEKHKRDLLDIADEIMINRNEFYNDKIGRLQNSYMRKIDANIKDKKTAYLIKQCLINDHTDVERMYKLFKKIQPIEKVTE